MRTACRLVMTPNYTARYLARYRTAHIFVLIPVCVNEEMRLSGVQLIYRLVDLPTYDGKHV
jgi:hypothetical protein